MKTDIKSLLEFAGVDVTQGKAKQLVEADGRIHEDKIKEAVQDPQERANRAIEHAKDELGEDATKNAILAFVKKMYEPETFQAAKKLVR